MKLENFDKAFENKLRLQIMSILMVNCSYDFNSFKDLLQVTDGNLASHLKALEKADNDIEKAIEEGNVLKGTRRIRTK